MGKHVKESKIGKLEFLPALYGNCIPSHVNLIGPSSQGVPYTHLGQAKRTQYDGHLKVKLHRGTVNISENFTHD